MVAPVQVSRPKSGTNPGASHIERRQSTASVNLSRKAFVCARAKVEQRSNGYLCRPTVVLPPGRARPQNRLKPFSAGVQASLW